MYVYVIKKKNLLSIKVYFKNEAISKMQQPRFARASMIKFDIFYLFYLRANLTIYLITCYHIRCLLFFSISFITAFPSLHHQSFNQ